ncbi:MAG: hypothetical protein K6F50_01750 [Kiritimatiellae bacterium]|nr:hypothetical protein [Kiritimatiellia bacterium]
MKTSTMKNVVSLMAVLAVACGAKATTNWQQGSADSEGRYLVSEGANWTGGQKPDKDSVQFTIASTATFDAMLNVTGWLWVGSTDGAFASDDSWCVWQSLNNSSDYGISAACKMAVSDADTQTGNVWIKSGSYSFTDFDWGLGNGPAKIKMTGGTLKAVGFTNLSGKPEAKLEIGGGNLDTDGEFVIGTTTGSTGVVYQTGGEFTPHKFWVGSRYEYAEGAYGKYVMTGGSLTTDADQDFVVGGMANSTGVVEVENGTVTVGGALLVPWADNAVGRMTVGSGSMIACAKGLVMGDNASGDGVFTMNGGKLTTGDSIYVAKGANATALLTLNGGEIESASGKNFYAGGGAGSKGEVVVNGGHLKVDSQIQLATASGSTGIVHVVSGTVTNTSWLVVGINTACHYSKLLIEGGEVYNGGNTTLGSGMGNGSQDELVVAGTGVLRTRGNIYIGEGHTYDGSNPASATVTVDGGLVDNSNGTTQFFNGNSISGTTGTLNLNGGEYVTKQIKYVNGSGNAVVNLGGGTLTAASGADAYMIYAQSGKDLSVNLVEGTTSTIDIAGQSQHINVPISGTGTLTVTGGGTLTLSKVPSSSIAVALDSDVTLIVPVGTEFSSLSVGDNANLIYSASEYTEGTEFTAGTISNLTLPDGEEWASHIFITTGTRTSNVLAMDGTTLKATVSAAAETDATTSIWIGGDSTSWTDADNWTAGVPNSTVDTAVFPCDARFRSNADIAVHILKISDGHTVKFHRSGGWPKLRVAEARGGTINLSCRGIGPVAGASAAIYSNVETDPTESGANQDCWIEGNSADETLDIYGNIYATNCVFRINGNVNLHGTLVCGSTTTTADNNRFMASTVKSGGVIKTIDGGLVKFLASSEMESGGSLIADGGTITLETGVTLPKGSTIGGAEGGSVNILGAATIGGNLAGAPTINISNAKTDVHLSGNNEEFAGVVNNARYDHVIYFDAATAGSPLATWNIVGDAQATFTGGTIKFGELNYSKNSWNVFYFPDADDAGITVEVGAKGGDFSMSAAGDCWFGKKSNNKQTPDVTLVKKGAGTMTFAMDRVKNLVIESGKVSLSTAIFPITQVTFAGGELAFSSDASVVDRSGRFASENTGNISIDTAGHDMSFATALKTAANIVKKGAGVLTLAAAPTCAGTQVLGGKLVLPLNTSVGTVTVAEGAELDVNGSSLEVAENTPYAILTGSADSDSLARIKLINSDWNWAIALGEGSISATATAWDANTPNVWVGGDSGNWTDASNWSRNIAPNDTHTLQFNYDATVAMTENSKNYAKLVLNNNANLTLTRGSGGEKFHLGAVEGAGTITLNNLGLSQINGSTLEIPNTVDMTMTNGSWFGDYEYNGLVKMYGDVTVSGDMGMWKSIEFHGKVQGSGNITMHNAGGTYGFYGDNRDFHGTITKNLKDTGLTIDSAESAGTNITWTIGADVTLNVASGTVKFGGLNLSPNGWCVMYFPDGATTEVEVGSRNEDMTFADGYFLWGTDASNRTNIDVTFKKVGTGTLTSNIFNFRHLIVEEGSAVLNNPTASFSGITQIDSVAVKSGAALSGNVGLEEGKLTIASLDFENGAILKATLADNSTTVDDVTTYSYSVVSPLAVSGTASVAGMKVQITNPEVINEVMGGDNEAAKTALLESKLSVLTATSITGNALLASTMTAEDRKIWRVKNTGTSLDLCEGKMGFLILLK